MEGAMPRSFRMVGAVLLVCTALAAPAAAEISSYAFVQPDGTLSVGGTPVRLFGIMFPPADPQCRTFERPVECAPRSVLQLGFRIGSNFVHCQEIGRDQSGVTVGQCRVEGEDLAAWMLLNGWALTAADAPFEYQQYERLAQAQGRGVWSMPVDNVIRPRSGSAPRASKGPPPGTPVQLPDFKPGIVQH
jgi:endonuclease YncB( thermonuclease family)